MASFFSSVFDRIEGFFTFFGIYSKIAAAKEQAILDLAKQGYRIEQDDERNEITLIPDEELGVEGGFDEDSEEGNDSEEDDSDFDSDESTNSEDEQNEYAYVHTDDEDEQSV
eukprot:m.60544 g.60544  ORF g.60544 m.60544 type:complete len:112 (+) comp22852_c0_seq1:307-642(+)